MLKYLRKYNKILLIGFGVFLMVAFLVPQALQELGKSSLRTTVLTVAGRKVSVQELQDATRQFSAITNITDGAAANVLGSTDKDSEHWIMAREAAKKAGMVGGSSDAQAIANAVAANLADRALQQDPEFMAAATPEARQAIIDRTTNQARAVIETRRQQGGGAGANAKLVDEGLASLLGVRRLMVSYNQAPRASAPRATAEARKLFDQVTAHVLFLDVNNKLSSDLPARSEEALKEQYDKYREVAPGTGEFGFGYRLQSRFKLEWLVLERKTMENAVRVDPIEVQKRFLAGPNANETDPAKRRAATDAIEAQIKREGADKLMQEAALAVKQEILQRTSRLSDANGYRELPADWATNMPRLANVAKAVPPALARASNVTIPEPPVYVREEAFLTPEELYALPGIGRAGLRQGSRLLPVPLVLTETKEARSRTEAPLVHIQSAVPITEPIEDEAGNRYFLTVLAAKPEGPPASMAEVLEKVVSDRKKFDAFETLKTQSAGYRLVAAEQGLEELAQQIRTSLGVPVEEVKNVQLSLARGPEPFNAKLADRQFVEAVITAAASIDPSNPIDETPVLDRTLVIPVPSKQGIAIVRIDGFNPLTVEQFRTRQVSEAAIGRIGVLAREDSTDNPFSAERLRQRMKVEHADKRAATPTGKDAPAGQ